MGKNDTTAIEVYRDLIPDRTRQELKAFIMDTAVEDIDAFLRVTQYVTAEVAAGNIPVAVADSIRGYLELMMTAVMSKINAETGGDSLAQALMSLDAAERGLKKRKKQHAKLLEEKMPDFDTLKAQAEEAQEVLDIGEVHD